MANTKRFNVTVKLGGKSYPPGEDVPIGGKAGLSKEEAEGLEDRFGPWKGRSLSDAEKIAHLTKDNQALQAQLRQAEKDNEILAARVTELEGAGADGKTGGAAIGGGSD